MILLHRADDRQRTKALFFLRKLVGLDRAQQVADGVIERFEKTPCNQVCSEAQHLDLLYHFCAEAARYHLGIESGDIKPVRHW